MSTGLACFALGIGPACLVLFWLVARSTGPDAARRRAEARQGRRARRAF